MQNSADYQLTVATWLANARQELESAGIATAWLDVIVLLEDSLERSRSWLLAHPEQALQEQILEKLNKQVAQRAHHEPLAYIRNRTEFYGRDFFIDNRVLEPRPESETMIDILKQLNPQPGAVLVDVGTGSGALAITAKLELPKTSVTAIDIDPGCLEVASRNIEQQSTAIQLLCDDLLTPLNGILKNAILLCNLPYVPDSFRINQAARHEPRLAIFGGPDGLDIYRRLFDQLKTATTQPSYILTEAMPPQHNQLLSIAKAAGFHLQDQEDFIQLFKSGS